jgi:RimJ/RimL family protein N-acetyltransferase
MPLEPVVLPELDTPRLLIRQRTLADLDACIEMDRDPDVTRYIAGPWCDPVAHRRFVEFRIRRSYPPGLGYWTIRETNSMPGVKGLRPRPRSEFCSMHSTEYGYLG